MIRTLDIDLGPALAAEGQAGLELLGDNRPPGPRPTRPVWWRSLVLAATLHLLVLFSGTLLGLLKFSTPEEPPPMQVSLVMLPPPPPPPPPMPARKPQEAKSAEAEPRFRASGSDKTTSTGFGIPDPTASPNTVSEKSASASAPEPVQEAPKEAPVPAELQAAPSPAPTPPAPQAPAPPPPAEEAVADSGTQQVLLPQQKPAPPKPESTPGAQPPAKTQTAALTPPVPHRLERGGMFDSTPRSLAPNGPPLSGDAYLNTVRDWILQHRVYPPQARALDLAGVAVYEIILDRAGKVLSVMLRESSGSTLLDQTGADAIRRSSPLPPVPSEFPGQSIRLTFRMLIAPT